MHKHSCFPAICAVALLGSAAVAPAIAATYTVGPVAGGCTHASVQQAVDAAAMNPGADTIRITRQSNWSAQQVLIDTPQDLDLIGGFALCNSTAPNAPNTTLSGAGGDARPVLTIRGNGIIRLRNLTIRDGDVGGSDSGGGINYIGGGVLDIGTTAIVDNSAYNGGGIFARGTTTAAEVVLGQDVNVQNNIARNDGGGVLANALEFSLVGPGSSILLNQALGQGGGGFGGGLLIFSDEFPAYGYISSNGVGGLGAIHGNSAVKGGGIAVYVGRESEKEAKVRVGATDSVRPIKISDNVASNQGGGIYLSSDNEQVFAGSGARASAEMWYPVITGNQAGDGAAAFLDMDSSFGFANFESPHLIINSDIPTAFLTPFCPTGAPCGQISGNSASAPDGAIIKVDPEGLVIAGRVEIKGNLASRLIRYRGEESSWLDLYNSLVTENVVDALIDQTGNGDEDVGFTLVHVTVVDNTVSGPWVIRARDDLELKASIIWQPGTPTLSGPAANPNILNVLSNDITHMPGGSGIVRAPRFIDPANGNYRLRAGAWGVDSAQFNPSDPNYQMQRETLDGGAHTVDLPTVGNDGLNQFADMGAYERPSISPLVLNSDFDTGLNLWDEVGLDSSWTNTQNASGPAGSGSMRIESNPGNTQCITLPAPGTYRLNGWGRVSPATLGVNRAVLRWQLRFDGSAFGCREGTVSGTGVHHLATNLSWTRPGQAAEIVVPAAEFLRGRTSLTIQPDATSSGATLPTAWFDGITLELDTAALFSDGFED